MAANSSSRGITAVGKRVANRIWTSKASSPSLSSRRGAAAYSSSSLYDKNPDDQLQSGPVPDDVIQATQSTKYWAPHPQTGVFGPPGPGGDQAQAQAQDQASPPTSDALEEKAWFRPTSIEDLEKPHTLN